jgi:hypothetical protein
MWVWAGPHSHRVWARNCDVLGQGGLYSRAVTAKAMGIDIDQQTMEEIWAEARRKGELSDNAQPSFRRLWGGGRGRGYW